MLHVHDHSLCSYSKDTKFDDLPQDMQAALMTLEAGIKKADTASDAVSVPSFNLESITESIKTLQAVNWTHSDLNIHSMSFPLIV